MDQIKIGKYIAGKRKSLGYTQVQLAEKLGMINVAKDGKKRNRKLKKIILVFAGMAIALAAVLIGVLYSEGYFLQNYVVSMLHTKTPPCLFQALNLLG